MSMDADIRAQAREERARVHVKRGKRMSDAELRARVLRAPVARVCLTRWAK